NVYAIITDEDSRRYVKNPTGEPFKMVFFYDHSLLDRLPETDLVAEQRPSMELPQYLPHGLDLVLEPLDSDKSGQAEQLLVLREERDAQSLEQQLALLQVVAPWVFGPFFQTTENLHAGIVHADVHRQLAGRGDGRNKRRCEGRRRSVKMRGRGPFEAKKLFGLLGGR